MVNAEQLHQGDRIGAPNMTNMFVSHDSHFFVYFTPLAPLVCTHEWVNRVNVKNVGVGHSQLQGVILSHTTPF